jgi:hypothetical protein
MFETMKEKVRQAQQERDKLRREQLRAEKLQQEEDARAKALDDEREHRIRAIRVITGEVKYRYAVLEVLRTIGYAEFEGKQLIDPDAATRRAIEQIQDLAFSIGADAVIQAQYQILRYTVQHQHTIVTPVYETHLFGTAIKLIGPPPDWQKPDNEI